MGRRAHPIYFRIGVNRPTTEDTLTRSWLPSSPSELHSAGCNNKTGRWYNPAYIRLTDGCRPHAVPAHQQKVLAPHQRQNTIQVVSVRGPQQTGFGWVFSVRRSSLLLLSRTITRSLLPQCCRRLFDFLGGRVQTNRTRKGLRIARWAW